MYARSRVERKSVLLIYSYVLIYITMWRCLEGKEEDECYAIQIRQQVTINGRKL
jgi:hypothetical protein